MTITTEARRSKLWFGTEQFMQFVPTPNQGADVSPSGWEAGGDLLNGGHSQLNSFGSHKSYIFEWPESSSRNAAQMMKSYSDGTYGRGLIYFLDPLIYDTNVFPAMWASPSMGIGYEGASLVYGLDPISLPTSGWNANLLPVESAYYDLTNIGAGWRGKEDAVFIPIPAGHTLHLGAIFSASVTGGVFYRTQSSGGGLGAEQALTAVSPAATDLVNESITSSSAGVWVWVGKTAADSSSVTLTAMTARITSDARPKPNIGMGPWIGGQGHSGCRFVGKPTYIDNTGVNGGQVGYAASFVEVGSWLYG